jgi:hypothetical protein
MLASRRFKFFGDTLPTASTERDSVFEHQQGKYGPSRIVWRPIRLSKVRHSCTDAASADVFQGLRASYLSGQPVGQHMDACCVPWNCHLQWLMMGDFALLVACN